MVRYADKGIASSGKSFGAEIRVDGLESTLGVLRALEPEAYKRINKVIRAAGLEVAKDASMEFAMTGHGMGRYSVAMRGTGRKAGMRIFVPSGGRDEAIFEFAKEGHTPQGRALVNWLDRRFGKPGRFLWSAWDAGKASFDMDLRSAMDDAEATIQGRLDAIGESY